MFDVAARGKGGRFPLPAEFSAERSYVYACLADDLGRLFCKLINIQGKRKPLVVSERERDLGVGALRVHVEGKIAFPEIKAEAVPHLPSDPSAAAVVDRHYRNTVAVMKVEFFSDKIVVGYLNAGIEFIGNSHDPHIRGQTLFLKIPNGFTLTEHAAHCEAFPGGHAV